jgi:Domain of unknown function (DUF892)
MAGYGCVREYARIPGQKEIASLLDETLKKEEAAHKKLGTIAKQVNCKLRMSVWSLLTIVGLALIIVIASALFFEPGHRSDLLNKSTPAAPNVKSVPESHH